MKKATKKITAIMLALALVVAQFALVPTGVHAYEVENGYTYEAAGENNENNQDALTPPYDNTNITPEDVNTESEENPVENGYEQPDNNNEDADHKHEQEEENQEQENENDYIQEEDENYEEDCLDYPLPYLEIIPFTLVETPLRFNAAGWHNADHECPNQTWIWEHATRRLYLYNFNAVIGGSSPAIELMPNTTINLVGTNNRIETTGNAAAIALAVGASGDPNEPITITGGGTLEIYAPNATSTNAITAPFLNINNATINILSSFNGIGSAQSNSRITIDNANINITARNIGINHDTNPLGTSFEATRSEININAGSMGIRSRGVTIGEQSEINIVSSTSTGINAMAPGAVLIYDSAVTIEAPNGSGISASSTLDIRDGSNIDITAATNGLTTASHLRLHPGITVNINTTNGHGISGSSSVTVTDVDLTIQAGNNGIHSGNGNVTITGGTEATIIAGGNGVQSTTGGVTISGSSNVTIGAEGNGVQGGTFANINTGSDVNIEAGGNGVEATTTVNINDAEVTIAADNNGIQSNNNVNITNGSEVNVNANNNGVSARDVIVEESGVDIDAGEYGIYVNDDAGSVTIDGDSSVSITAGEEGIYDRDGAVEIEIDDDADVTVNIVVRPPDDENENGDDDNNNNDDENEDDDNNENDDDNNGDENNDDNGDDNENNNDNNNQGGGNGGGGNVGGGNIINGGQPEPAPAPTVQSPTQTHTLPNGLTARVSGNRVNISLSSSRIDELIYSANGVVSLNISEISNATSLIISRAALRNFGDADLGLQVLFTNTDITFTAAEIRLITEIARTSNITFTINNAGEVNVYAGLTRLSLNGTPQPLTDAPPAQPQQAPQPMPLTLQPTPAPAALRLAIGQTSFVQSGMPQPGDTAPFIENGRTMVPLRVIAEALNAQVNWDEYTSTVTISQGGTALNLTINEPLPNDMGTAVIVNDRTFVPARYVSEMLGASVRWDADQSAVYVYA